MGFEIENGILKKYKEEPGVTEVVIPDSVTSIGYGAFWGCKSLTPPSPYRDMSLIYHHAA